MQGSAVIKTELYHPPACFSRLWESIAAAAANFHICEF